MTDSAQPERPRPAADADRLTPRDTGEVTSTDDPGEIVKIEVEIEVDILEWFRQNSGDPIAAIEAALREEMEREQAQVREQEREDGAS